MAKKEVKVGVHRGGGVPPGYCWTVLIPDIAFAEARNFLNSDQYQHMTMQVKEIAKEDDPTHSEFADVKSIEDFFELRDKGGILGGMNVRLFFFLDKRERFLVILGAIKKQNDGPTPKGDRKRMSRRKRRYLNGEFGAP